MDLLPVTLPYVISADFFASCVSVFSLFIAAFIETFIAGSIRFDPVSQELFLHILLSSATT